jgi:purine-cytosine permease-like protein
VRSSLERFRGPDSLCVAGALVLLVTLLAVPWYGVIDHSGGALSGGRPGSLSGWSQLTVTRWVVLAAAVVALLLAAPARRTRAARAVRMVLALLALALLVVRVLLDPPSSATIVDVKLGAYISLLGAAALALGAGEALLSAP